MRALFAATAIATAVALAPIQARLEPLAPDVTNASDTDAPPQPMQTQGTGQATSDSDWGAFKAALDAWFSVLGAEDVPGAGTASPAQERTDGTASANAICAKLDQSASANDLPLAFFTRLIWQESRFNPSSISHAGAQGIAQFMPGTARMVGLVNPFDPLEALTKSAALLRDLRAQFGNLGLAAAAYNAGPKRVVDWLARRKLLPQETEDYVRIITGRSAQEWTHAESADWSVMPPAPAPCERLAKSAPRNAPVITAARQAEKPEPPTHPVAAALKTNGALARAHRETIRCCHLPEKGEKAAEPSRIASRETIRCCRLPARGMKLAHLEDIAAPKSIMVEPKSGEAKGAHSRLHLLGPPARGSTGEAPHASKREQPGVPHRRAPNPRTARLA